MGKGGERVTCEKRDIVGQCETWSNAKARGESVTGRLIELPNGLRFSLCD
jgi:hypothetical protein